jgi:hypothetical protein
MTRAQLEHILRAAGAIAGDHEIVVIGSQAVLAQFPDAPAELLVSEEADVFPKNVPDRAVEIDGAIGERSLFHQTHAIYAHGVSEETATLPAGWKGRLIRVANENTGGITGWCLEVHDLAISKLVAGREKDLAFVRALAKHKMVNATTMEQRLQQVPLDAERLALARARLSACTRG